MVERENVARANGMIGMVSMNRDQCGDSHV